ncbi:MAG: luciferase [Thermoleophilia bacterium]|nr:luciferase [Thermoleophilia bacterium]MCZ4496325.1 luciferase [Thermoleophilia bacterium]
MELGVYSFGELTPNPVDGTRISPEERMANLLEEVELAERVGLDVFAMGEHHREEYLVSAPAVFLAAAAARTSRIRLSSAVTVLSSDDPVRVFQDFALIDLISKGRAEIIAGRGSFIESFPLFGLDLQDYDELFAEKLELLLRINRGDTHVTWSGRHRAALTGQGVYPRPSQEELPIWIAVGGSPPSVVRAAQLGAPLAIAIIGGDPAGFVPFADLYRRALAEFGGDVTLPVSINSFGYVADDAQQARDEFYPSYEAGMRKIAAERGFAPPNRATFDATCGPSGAYFVGTPEEVAAKVLHEYDLFGHQRFLMQTSLATLPHEQVLRSIELFGTEVAPLVRAGLAERAEGH